MARSILVDSQQVCINYSVNCTEYTLYIDFKYSISVRVNENTKKTKLKQFIDITVNC